MSKHRFKESDRFATCRPCWKVWARRRKNSSDLLGALQGRARQPGQFSSVPCRGGYSWIAAPRRPPARISACWSASAAMNATSAFPGALMASAATVGQALFDFASCQIRNSNGASVYLAKAQDNTFLGYGIYDRAIAGSPPGLRSRHRRWRQHVEKAGRADIAPDRSPALASRGPRSPALFPHSGPRHPVRPAADGPDPSARGHASFPS